MDSAAIEAMLHGMAGDVMSDASQQRHEQYRNILQNLVQTPQGDERRLSLWRTFIDTLLLESATMARELLADVTNALHQLPPEDIKEIARYTLHKIQPRVLSFEEQATALRIILADIYEREQKWTDSARVLGEISFESGHTRGHVSLEQRVNVYVRIAILYMKDGNLPLVEEYMGRAQSAMSELSRAAEAAHPGETPAETPAELAYKELQAELLDKRCRFLEAAQRYYPLSFTTSEERRTLFLEKAVTCAILASAGPQRSRMLATLYKDDRTHKLLIFDVLKKMYLERIIHPEELDRLGALATHQMAQKSTDSTMMEHAVLEHSILAVSKLYQNISFIELGALLRTSPGRAERMAAQMVMEERMRASIDQIEGVIRFETGMREEAGQNALPPIVFESIQGIPLLHKLTTQRFYSISANPTEKWDSSIREICTQVNRILDRVAVAEPAWMAAQVPNNT